MQQKPLFLRQYYVMHVLLRQIFLLGLMSVYGIGYGCPTIDSYDITPATCTYSSDAVLTVNATGTGVLQYSLDGVNFQASPTFTNLVPGLYIVSVQSSAPCTVTDTVMVYSTSFLSASASVSPVDTVFINENVILYDNSFNASTWTFYLGDGNDTSDVATITHSYSSAGIFIITLVASDGVCFDTSAVQIVVTGNSSLKTPNVFTPNNDDVNDIWRPDAVGIREMKCVIMNRYGEIVHQWTGDNGFWDGHTFPAGLPCPEGTYFYFIEAMGFDGKSYSQNGTITLLR